MHCYLCITTSSTFTKLHFGCLLKKIMDAEKIYFNFMFTFIEECGGRIDSTTFKMFIEVFTLTYCTWTKAIPVIKFNVTSNNNKKQTEAVLIVHLRAELLCWSHLEFTGVPNKVANELDLTETPSEIWSLP